MLLSHHIIPSQHSDLNMFGWYLNTQINIINNSLLLTCKKKNKLVCNVYLTYKQYKQKEH